MERVEIVRPQVPYNGTHGFRIKEQGAQGSDFCLEIMRRDLVLEGRRTHVFFTECRALFSVLGGFFGIGRIGLDGFFLMPMVALFVLGGVGFGLRLGLGLDVYLDLSERTLVKADAHAVLTDALEGKAGKLDPLLV